MTQLTLQGVTRLTSHANRGRAFQAILNNTHLWYERQNWGKVYEIPNSFSFVSEWLWRKSPEELRARTARSAPLLRVKSAPDYLGGICGQHIEFDAKEFAGASISIQNFKEHQVNNLLASERAGNTAGFMVLEKRTGAVYWVWASYVRAWLDRIRRGATSAKSLNFSKITPGLICKVCEVERNSVAHYAPNLIIGFADKRRSRSPA